MKSGPIAGLIRFPMKSGPIAGISFFVGQAESKEIPAIGPP
jgi:hypothetical protein